MAAGWRIRGFELDRRLGAGASSEVWRATASVSGDAVALKRLPLAGAEHARRAVAEAAKLRVLDHPHLIRLHDLVLHRDAAVLVLDLADAGSLADLLAVRGRLTPGEAITAIAPVAAALAHVHAAGIVHGDISPANILFTPGGVPLLADLGVSRLTGDDTDAESTPAYVDPLVARGGVPTSYSDVFMLGAVALHALTGAPLWTASTGDAALAQASSAGLGHVEGRFAMADLPPAMAAVLRRALTLEPAYRGTAADFALDLRHSGQPVAVELAAGRARLMRAPPDVRVADVRPVDERQVPPPASLTHQRLAPAAVLPAPAVLPPAVVPPPAAAVPRATAVPAPAGVPVPAARPVGPPAGSARSGGGRHAATQVARPRRRVSKRQASTAERARSLIAARTAHPPGPVSPGPVSPDPVLPDAARPHFTRPTAVVTGEVVVGRPAPTNAVARARPTLPAPRRVPPAVLAAGAAGLVVLVAVVLGLTLWRGGDATSAAGSPPATMPTPSTVTTLPSQAAVGHIARAAGPDWVSKLRALDGTRARAFATRDATLLGQVYVAGPLRGADAASLARLVPPGCGLRGVRTTYSAITTRDAGSSVVLSARASLPRSRLICSGRVVRTAAAVGPLRMQVTLVRRGSGVRIAAEHVIA